VRECVYFSVENSFSKVSWNNFLDADGNRDGFYGMFSPRKKYQRKIFEIYDTPVLNENNTFGYFGHHSSNSNNNKK